MIHVLEKNQILRKIAKMSGGTSDLLRWDKEVYNHNIENNENVKKCIALLLS